MQRRMLTWFTAIIISFFIIQPVNAWQSHFLITFAALKDMSEINLDAPIPAAETLTEFLESESDGLVELFKSIDELPKQANQFPALPAELAFRGKSDTTRSLLQQFTDRARINPQIKFDTLFIQYAPEEIHTISNPLQVDDIVFSPIANTLKLTETPFEKINSGDLVPPFRIITSAVDEPDYGMDINLWENSNTEFGKRYRLGNQPFGNVTTPISSQAAFHMGFYYEPFQLYLANSNLKRTYPEYRINFFLRLSLYAFKTHHPYWGYRFLGWSIHYLQDLNQPYHSTVAPGVLSWRLMWAYEKGGDTLQKFIQTLTNKHFSLENYQYYLLKAQFENINQSKFIQALADRKNDQYHRVYGALYPRLIVAAESYKASAQIDDTIERLFSTYTKPDYIFGTTEPDINLYSKVNSNDRLTEQLNNQLIFLFKALGSHTRKIILYALDPKNQESI